ncbi:MAG: metal ABC transporter permease [Clostridia bacterium]|nr:metal ABC transporter permease [Clostridia bacterium]
MQIFHEIAYYFSYSFILRGFLVGLIVALCAGLLGVNLVLKRCSMIGDGLSHVGFGSLAVAAAMGAAPLSVAIPAVIVAALLMTRIAGSKKMDGDAAIAVISTSALAIGTLILSVSEGMNTDLESYMFGSLLAAGKEDLVLCLILGGAVVLSFVLIYPTLFAVTFDGSFARSAGIRVELVQTGISVLAAITVVLGMRLLGALLISALILFPCLTAMRIFSTFRSVVVCSAVLSLFCFSVGFVASCLLDAPPGATVVVTELAAFLAFTAIAAIKRKISSRASTK